MEQYKNITTIYTNREGKLFRTGDYIQHESSDGVDYSYIIGEAWYELINFYIDNGHVTLVADEDGEMVVSDEDYNDTWDEVLEMFEYNGIKIEKHWLFNNEEND